MKNILITLYKNVQKLSQFSQLFPEDPQVLIDKLIIYIIIIVIMGAFFKPPFRKFVKKQTRSFQLIIEDEVEKIIITPDIGETKKGDLTGFRVHKFVHRKQKFLIAYRSQDEGIIFFKVGPHENFYRKLKKYLREVEL